MAGGHQALDAIESPVMTSMRFYEQFVKYFVDLRIPLMREGYALGLTSLTRRLFGCGCMHAVAFVCLYVYLSSLSSLPYVRLYKRIAFFICE